MAVPLRPYPPPPSSLMAVRTFFLNKKSYKKSFFFLMESPLPPSHTPLLMALLLRKDGFLIFVASLSHFDCLMYLLKTSEK